VFELTPTSGGGLDGAGALPLPRANAAIVQREPAVGLLPIPTRTPNWWWTLTGTSRRRVVVVCRCIQTVPCRVIDTRKIGNGQAFTGTLSPPVDVVDIKQFGWAEGDIDGWDLRFAAGFFQRRLRR
jgi:hypothetical protein